MQWASLLQPDGERVVSYHWGRTEFEEHNKSSSWGIPGLAYPSIVTISLWSLESVVFVQCDSFIPTRRTSTFELMLYAFTDLARWDSQAYQLKRPDDRLTSAFRGLWRFSGSKSTHRIRDNWLEFLTTVMCRIALPHLTWIFSVSRFHNSWNPTFHPPSKLLVLNAPKCFSFPLFSCVLSKCVWRERQKCEESRVRRGSKGRHAATGENRSFVNYIMGRCSSRE